MTRESAPYHFFVQKVRAAIEISKLDDGIFNGGDRHGFRCVCSVFVGTEQLVIVLRNIVCHLCPAAELFAPTRCKSTSTMMTMTTMRYRSCVSAARTTPLRAAFEVSIGVCRQRL